MRHIFVWTFSDVVGLVILALVLLFAGFIGLVALWEKARSWWVR